MESQLVSHPRPTAQPMELAEQASVAATGEAGRLGWSDYAALPCRAVVYLPLQQITLDELFRIAPGTVFCSSHHFTDFLFLRVNSVFIANVSLEPAGLSRGVRLHDFESQGNLAPRATVSYLAPVDTGSLSGQQQMTRSCTVPLSLCFGTATLLLKDALQFTAGQLITLDSKLTDPVSLIVNDRVIAYGTPVLHADCYSIHVTEVVGPPRTLPVQ